MMYGAYSTTRRLAVARIFLRFLWFSVASVVISFLYVYVFNLFSTFLPSVCFCLGGLALFPSNSQLMVSFPLLNLGKHSKKKVNGTEILLFSDYM